MIAQLEQIEEELIGNIDTINSTIDVNNLPFIYELVSSRLYGDPIGSVCRELTSNCVDAHIDANVTDPIVINLEKDIENDAFYLEFCDKGFGINEEKFQTVYMSWFNSSKRKSNKFTGFYGIGSKVSLAYNDYFYITTTADGYTTKYILSKSNSGPKADKLIDTHYTGNQSGTTIRVDIKNSSDKDSFILSLRKQLCYFEDVYIKSSFYSFDNSFRIYEGKYFKFRSGNIPYTSMHIVLGQVVYPINYSLLGINEIDIPVGIKFQIGELFVTPSRESLDYSPEGIKLILEKIELAKQELITKFNSQNPAIDSLYEWWNKKGEVPTITFQPDYDLTIKDSLKVKGLGLKTSHVFGPLKGIDIPNYPLFEYEVQTLSRGVVGKKVDKLYTPYALQRASNCYFAHKTDKYNNAYISNGQIVVEKKKSFQDICEELGIHSYRIKYQRSWYKQVSKNENGYGNTSVRVPILGTAKMVYQYRKVMREYLMQHCKAYPNVSAQWIEDYKKEQRDNSAQIARRANQGFFYSTSNEKRVESTIREMQKSKIVFYCDKDCSVWSHKMSDYESLIKQFYKYYKGRKKNHSVKNGKSYYSQPKKEIPMYRFIILNPTNYKIAKNLDNLVHIEEFFNVEEFQKLFNNLYFANLYNKFNHTLSDYRIGMVSEYYKNLKNEVQAFCRNYYVSNISNFEEGLKNIPIKNHPCTWRIRKAKKELQVFVEKADILRYISSGIPEEHLKKIVKSIQITKLKQSLYGN